MLGRINITLRPVDYEKYMAALKTGKGMLLKENLQTKKYRLQNLSFCKSFCCIMWWFVGAVMKALYCIKLYRLWDLVKLGITDIQVAMKSGICRIKSFHLSPRYHFYWEFLGFIELYNIKFITFIEFQFFG